MNYIGSKFSLLEFLETTIKSCVGDDLSKFIFCDGFAGTGVVGAKFKNEVAKMISNDIEFYSFVLNQNLVANQFKISKLDKIVSQLEQLDTKMGKIYEFYAPSGSDERAYFSDENAKKIDTLRFQIENLKAQISNGEYFCLLASLLESADKVANTASVYGAFLKKMKKSALKPLEFKLAKFTPSIHKNEVYNQDLTLLMDKIGGDILYLDPPYNHREYGANYHILNTIAFYDDFEPRGKTGLRKYEKSKWCKKASAASEFENLIKKANFKYIFLSYNNEGIIQPDQIRQICEKYGKYDIFSKDYRRFKADNSRTHKATQTVEYLHFLEKL